MLVFPNCKINIGLYVTRRRDDGYHDIATVFYPLMLHDSLEAVPAPAPALHMTGLAVAGDTTDNLVWKAYVLLQEKFAEKIPPLDIYLQKTIPMGAGLGGGSADGAYMLRLLNELCDLRLGKKELVQLALQLGSDCPFFIYNKPVFATGRGEVMQEIPLDLSNYSIQLVCPGIHVTTGKAFSLLTPQQAGYDLSALPGLPIEQWRAHVSNDFEKAVFGMHPELEQIKEELYRHGALYASMSGSGSAIYGIFEKGKKAEISTGAGANTYYQE